MNRPKLRFLFSALFVSSSFFLAGSSVYASTVVFDRFTRQENETTPFPLQGHQADNGGVWTKSTGSADYRLSASSTSLTQSGSGVVRYYNSTTVSNDIEVGVLLNKNGATGSNNYISPIVRTNSAGTSGIWAELDFSAGTVRLRQAYSPFNYISNTSTSTGFSFPSSDYYVVVGASSSTYYMYVKQISTGMWLNPSNKLFDSSSRIAVVSATDTQSGNLIGIGGFTSTGSPLTKQIDLGDLGSLTDPLLSASTRPRSLVATPGDGQVVLSWLAPISDGGSTITHYSVYSSSTNSFIASSTSASISLTGLTNGIYYSYYVTATNSVGESASSSPVLVMPRSSTEPIVIDKFTRGVSESSPFLLQSHQAENGSSWTKSLTAQEYTLSATSSSLRQGTGGALRYYNSTNAESDTEVGLLIDTTSAVGFNNYISPIVRTNSAGTSGIWAEVDMGRGSVGLRRAYTPFSSSTYITSSSSATTGFSFPAGEYYIVVGVTGSNYSMYVKRVSTGMWLNLDTRSFDSTLRMAVATGTDSQAGGLVGIGGFTTSGGTSPLGMQFDIGGVGTLFDPATSSTTVPSEPLNPTATPGDGQIALSWDTPTSPGGSAITHYSVYSHPSNELATTTPATSVTIPGLSNGTQYSYHVTASNAAGASASSSVVSATPFATVTLPVTDASFETGLSPYVWYKGDGFVTSAGGSNAYFKVGFTGPRFGLEVDVSSQVSASMNAIAYPVLKYRIDGGEYQTIQLTGTSSVVTLASNLSEGNHTVEAYYQRNMYYDSWNTPVQQLKITGIVLEEGSELNAFPVRSRRMLVYGDSIAEGQWVDQTSSGNTGQSGIGALIANSTRVYITQLAEALDAEFGNTAVGGQGWTSGGLTNVPGLVSAWSLYSAGRSRLTDGKILPNPDMVFINMGTNGGVSAASTVTNWLTSLRSAVSTSTAIYLNIPFNGTGRANITSGFNAYMESNPSDRTYLIDLGTISGYTTTDGLHPNGAGNDRVASLLEDAILSITVPSAPLNPQVSLDDLTASLSWDTPLQNGSSTILGYRVYQTGTDTLVATTSSSTAVITGLSNGTEYSYYVRAFNAMGESDPSDTTSVTTTPAPQQEENQRPIPHSGTSAARRASNLAALGQQARQNQAAVNADQSALQRLISVLLGENKPASDESPETEGLASCPNMTVGSKGDCVLLLQRYLNERGFVVSLSGAGSPGLETLYFGLATQSALSGYQVSKGITPSIGYFGPKTRATIGR